MEGGERNKFGKTLFLYFGRVAECRNQCYFSSALTQQSSCSVAVDIAGCQFAKSSGEHGREYCTKPCSCGWTRGGMLETKLPRLPSFLPGFSVLRISLPLHPASPPLHLLSPIPSRSFCESLVPAPSTAESISGLPPVPTSIC